MRRSKPCAIEGCSRRHYARGWCSLHYGRWYHRGDLGGPEMRRSPNGAGSVQRDGYRMMRVQNRAVLEHRLVMEQVLGRPLLPHETVHHINGDRLDNRPENLELWSKSQPPGQRVADKVAWAIELLRQYDPASLNETQRNGDTHA